MSTVKKEQENNKNINESVERGNSVLLIFAFIVILALTVSHFHNLNNDVYFKIYSSYNIQKQKKEKKVDSKKDDIFSLIFFIILVIFVIALSIYYIISYFKLKPSEAEKHQKVIDGIDKENIAKFEKFRKEMVKDKELSFFKKEIYLNEEKKNISEKFFKAIRYLKNLKEKFEEKDKKIKILIYAISYGKDFDKYVACKTCEEKIELFKEKRMCMYIICNQAEKMQNYDDNKILSSQKDLETAKELIKKAEIASKYNEEVEKIFSFLALSIKKAEVFFKKKDLLRTQRDSRFVLNEKKEVEEIANNLIDEVFDNAKKKNSSSADSVSAGQ